jgi:predicted dienelactone hydrolase
MHRPFYSDSFAQFLRKCAKRNSKTCNANPRLIVAGSSIGALPITSSAKRTFAPLISAVKEQMSAQLTVSLSTIPKPFPTASQEDLQTAAGYRELAAQAKRFGEQAQGELSDICHHLAQEATRLSEGCAANADFLEK